MKQSTLPWVPAKRSDASGSGSNNILWENDDQWQRHKAALLSFPINSKLKVIELCGGLGTAFVALQMLMPSECLEIIGHWDTDFELAEVLNTVHPDCHCVHLGAINGDIMKWDIESVPLCNVLVGGPPCPPFSPMGRKECFSDPRAGVFWRCVDIVLHQAKVGTLMFFVLENVDGLKSRPQGSSRSPCEIIIDELTIGLSSDWVVAAISCNSLNYGLPQRRPRTYIIGHRKSLSGEMPLVAPRSFQAQVPLHRFLDTADVSELAFNTPKQEQNVCDWKQWYKSHFPQSVGTHDYAVVDISRTPTERTSWSSKGTPPGVVQCLTTSGPSLHIFSLSPCGHDCIDRRLRNCERARLQGFPPYIVKLARETTTWKRFIGNAMSVPVIGSILATELSNVLNCIGPARLAAILRNEMLLRGSKDGELPHVTPMVAPQASSSDPLELSAPPEVPDRMNKRHRTSTKAALRYVFV